MVFTKEDAQDDSKLKEEVAPQMQSTAKRTSGKFWKHFRNVAENVDREPKRMLADMLVRALNNQDYADRIENTEVSAEAISKGTYRKEDIELVKELADTFDLTPDTDGGSSLVEDVIEQRLEAVSSSPLDNLSGDDNGGDGDNSRQVRQLQSQIQQLNQQVQDLKSEEQNGEVDVKERQAKSDSGKKSMDDLFGDDDSDSNDDEGDSSSNRDVRGSDTDVSDMDSDGDSNGGEVSGSDVSVDVSEVNTSDTDETQTADTDGEDAAEDSSNNTSSGETNTEENEEVDNE